ncbi:hypothetical protein TPHA_0D02880 [Tetrapisispora phaffii CBS 4417]|uniref:STI1 domain-containing protein n=1 Tax=Tetrapisispora phaffii (strain ATCC 24235 / CBS 4417 / NBRC 1672 / NRRL Y-8282 / UCD 70-5) TaxID=1071381 RepID=G8BSV3_TETPH|nr:hypothetical protein TPHA_0D02880 [Tetrapisispora phaffii CBS 4417]CCE62924.1 hypothetical protein TPHA_0D02880 [Tetrapisispora phaffii CBS 4417]
MSLSADEYKQQGNTAFSAKEYEKAVDLFSKAIEVSPEPNHVLYSNRSACYTSLKKFTDALNDANECTKINPTWSKGYNRVGAAHYGLGDLDEAEKSYKKALELDASNKVAQEGLEQVKRTQEARKAQPDMGLTSMFNDPNLIEKLKSNPKTAEMMNDPQLVAKLLSYRSNSQALSTELFSDPRLMTIMATLLGVDLNMGDLNGSNSMPPTAEKTPEAPVAATKETKTETVPESKEKEPVAANPENMEVDDADVQKKLADAEKDEGNKLYKAHKFDEAIEHYDKAWELHNDITYLNNKAAAQYEKGDYETTIKTLEDAIEKGRELRADYKIIAKAFTRMGNAYEKLNDLKKAAEFFNKSLTEFRTPATLTKLRSLEKKIKVQEAEAYINPEKAEEARIQGKDFFNKGQWPDAVKAYTEMIARAPDDARAYSNRAAALSKLMSFPEAISDCEKALEKDPNFVKAYIRKATAQIAIKEYSSALETLDIARSKDTELNNGSNIREINQLYAKATQQRFEPASSNETPEQTYQRAMKDPEVAAIMQDPVMQSILQQAQTNPAALQEHMKNPEIFKKIQTLISAGIIRTGP